MKKAELHCHSDALLDAAMLRELVAEGHAIDLTPEALEAASPVKSWDDWRRGYGRITAGKLDARGAIATAAKHVERLVRQDVVYAELFVCGYLMPGRPAGEAIAFYERLREAVDAAAAGRIQVERHSIARARELGMSFSVSTDDPAPFACSMASEYALLESRLGFGEADFARMLVDARAASFAARGVR